MCLDLLKDGVAWVGGFVALLAWADSVGPSPSEDWEEAGDLGAFSDSEYRRMDGATFLSVSREQASLG